MSDNDFPATIEPALLTWAREKAGLDRADIDDKMELMPGTCKEWEIGGQPIMFREALLFAAVTNAPFGCLFLPEPPADPELLTIKTALELVLAADALLEALEALEASRRECEELRAEVERLKAPCYVAPEAKGVVTLVIDLSLYDQTLIEPGVSICADVWFDGAGMVHALSGEVLSVDLGATQ